MPSLKDRTKVSLDEVRILILGAEVLLGVEYASVFQKGFERLPEVSQYLKIGSLSVMLVAVALLIAPVPYHHLVLRGSITRGFLRFVNTTFAMALLPFAVGMGLDLYVAGDKLSGPLLGTILATATVGLAIALWYGLGLLRARSGSKGLGGEGRNERKPVERDSDEEEQPPDGEATRPQLKDRINEALTEARVVLPGIQALLGFQFAVMFNDAFDKLSTASKYVHLGSLLLVALSTILLIAPAAYHRIVEEGNDTERFYRFTSRMVLASMLPLALGIAGDLYVVLKKVTASTLAGVIGALLALALFYGLWFGYTLLRRGQEKTGTPARQPSLAKGTNE